MREGIKFYLSLQSYKRAVGQVRDKETSDVFKILYSFGGMEIV